MSQNVWATIMPFGPVTLIFYWPKKKFGPGTVWGSPRVLQYSNFDLTSTWFCLFACLMVFFNISVISWWSVLLVEETGEHHRPVSSHWQNLSHNVVHLALIEIRTHNIYYFNRLKELKNQHKFVKDEYIYDNFEF